MTTNTLTPALSHPMGEGESSSAIAELPTVARTRLMLPTPVRETIATARRSSDLSDEMNSLKDKIAIITGAVGTGTTHRKKIAG